MGFLNLTSRGWWSVTSKKDPRWDRHGYTDACGGFSCPPEAKSHIDQLKKKLGDPPEDLEWGYMKE